MTSNTKYCVVRDGNFVAWSPRVFHTEEATAIAEAKRLAAECPKCTFVVYEVTPVGQAHAVAVEWVPLR